MERKYAGFWIRLVAALIDGIILGIAAAVFSFMIGFIFNSEAVSGIRGILSDILGIAASISYYVFYQHSTGQTLGKKALGLKVVNEEGATPSYLTFFLREIIGKLVSGIILGIGYLMVAFDSKKQGLHDKIAGTYVIRV